MSLPSLNEILDNFSYLEDWSDRYSYLIELGNALEPLEEGDYQDTYLVHGCASRVWMIFATNSDKRIFIKADSDAHIVRGLVGLILALYSGHTAQEILNISADETFEQLNLSQHLTPQRTNGFAAIVQRIRAEARAVLG